MKFCLLLSRFFTSIVEITRHFKEKFAQLQTEIAHIIAFYPTAGRKGIAQKEIIIIIQKKLLISITLLISRVMGPKKPFNGLLVRKYIDSFHFLPRTPPQQLTPHPGSAVW